MDTLTHTMEVRSDTCQMCLSKERAMHSVQDLQWAFCILIDSPKMELDANVRVCWECHAVLVRLARVRSQALRAQRILGQTLHQGGNLDSIEGKGMSRLSNYTKTFYDADFIFHDFTTSPRASGDDPALGSEAIDPKTEGDCDDDTANAEAWADPPAFTEVDCVIEEPPEETSKFNVESAANENTEAKVDPQRRRPAKESAPAKMEMFTATSLDVANFRRRAFKHLMVYPFTCTTCVVGFLTEEKLNGHNLKYHSEQAGTHVCDICSSRFAQAKLLDKHRAAHYVMYRCKHPDCDFQHPTIYSVRCHYASHLPKDKDATAATSHQCDVCEKRFRTAQGLSVHRQTHTSRSVYKCHHCDKTFKTRTQIHIHLPHHTLKVMCDVCGIQFPSQHRLKQHSLAHLDPSHRPYGCELCHKRFIDKYKLLLHTRQHSGEKPFKCDICGSEYVSKEQLSQHTRKRHSDGGNTRIREFKPRTKSVFRNERTFPENQQKDASAVGRKKQEDNTPNTSDKYECNVCGRRLSTYQNLQSHYGVHSNERPVKCDECDSTFKYKPQLYAHKLRHRGDKRYQCPTCGSRFAFKSVLNNHLQSHSNEKPYKCDACDLTFKYNSGLWTHKLTHKGEKPHQCNICGARFTLKGNLTGHMKTHTNEKPFECELCGRKFPWRRNLKNHYKTHAKEKQALEAQ